MTGRTDAKAAARSAALARRAGAHAAAQSGAADILSEVLAAHAGEVVAGYMPIRTEIDPVPAMAAAAGRGTVCVPVVLGAGLALKFSRWTPGCALREGAFGALVPETEDFVEPRIVVAPLVAFDRRGGRLGYGGGFYDRTLERLRRRGGAVAIGFAYAAQETDDLPQEGTDQPLDMVVTEREAIRFG